MSRFAVCMSSLVALGLAIAGCGKVTPNQSDAGASCNANQTECSGTCVNTDTDPLNCGDCGETCSDGLVCSQGDCADSCADGLDACDGSCVDFDTDHDHCGTCSNECAEDEGCVEGICQALESMAVPQIIKSWPDPTGWEKPDGTPIEMEFAPVPVSGITYHCRTGHASIIGALPFEPCDGGDGTRPVYRPVPMVNMEEGSYRTDMRLLFGAWVSDVVSHEYYVHHSLDRVPACPRPIPDEQVFQAAQLLLDTSGTFPSSGMDLRNPTIRLPFTDVIITTGMRGGSPGKWQGVRNFTVELNSLRRRFVLNQARNLLLVTRNYESRRARAHQDPGTACMNGFAFGNNWADANPPVGPSRHSVDCPYFVLNRRGQAVCLEPNPQSPGTVRLRLRSDIGFVKLQRIDSFSAKGPTETCPNRFQTACTWYLELPE